MNKEDMKVGMLIKHVDSTLIINKNHDIWTGSDPWAGSTGVIIKLKKVGIPNDKGEIPLTSFPDILWQDGQVGTAHCQYLEVLSENR